MSGADLVLAGDAARQYLPEVGLAVARQRREELAAFVRDIMVPDLDFGVIPGTAKPTLYQPGAEKLGAFFGLSTEFVVEDKIEDWDKPFFMYRMSCRVMRGDLLVTTGSGSANSYESRYRWRWVKAADLPRMGLTPEGLATRGGSVSEPDFIATNKDKWATTGAYGKPQEYWDEWAAALAAGAYTTRAAKSKAGKDLLFYERDATEYRVPNEDIFSLVNTLLKMASKRAFVEAIKRACNASDFFSQDLEDLDLASLDLGPRAVRRAAEPILPFPAETKAMKADGEATAELVAEVLTRKSPPLAGKAEPAPKAKAKPAAKAKAEPEVVPATDEWATALAGAVDGFAVDQLLVHIREIPDEATRKALVSKAEVRQMEIVVTLVDEFDRIFTEDPEYAIRQLVWADTFLPSVSNDINPDHAALLFGAVIRLREAYGEDIPVDRPEDASWQGRLATATTQGECNALARELRGTEHWPAFFPIYQKKLEELAQ